MCTRRFLRDDDNEDEQQLSWDDQVARKYYSSLYREFAVCDLKHYKSGSVSLVLQRSQYYILVAVSLIIFV